MSGGSPSAAPPFSGWEQYGQHAERSLGVSWSTQRKTLMRYQGPEQRSRRYRK